MKRLYWRTYYTITALARIAILVLHHAKPSPELGPLGRTRWRCLCCIWRWHQSHADHRIGLSTSPEQALKRRIDKSWFGEVRDYVRRRPRTDPTWFDYAAWVPEMAGVAHELDEIVNSPESL